MRERYGYSPRVTRGEDGVYRWLGKLDRSQRMNAVKITLGVCGGMSLLFIAAALLIGRDMLWVTLLSTAAVMVIAVGVSWLYYRSTENAYQAYEMTDDHIRHAETRRNHVIIPFKSIRRLTIRPAQDHMVVRTRMMVVPIFIPHEDFGTVQDYILRRLPPDAEVIYE